MSTQAPSRTTQTSQDVVPEVVRRYTPWLIDWFRWYVRGYVKKHFHAVRVSGSDLLPKTLDGPILVVLNHPSWWDPLIGALLSSFWPRRRYFVPIDAAALKKYAFFSRMGFFGIEPESVRGGRQFLRTGLALTRAADSMIWITAQGEFTDPRQRPLQLRPGVGHLAARMDHGFILPVALEYPFWTERTAEVLVRFGEPLTIDGNLCLSGRDWTERIARRLEDTQDDLAELALRRDPSAFDSLLTGRTGVGGIFDIWRRFWSYVRCRPFRPEHGEPS